jgi:hypothetical protein
MMCAEQILAGRAMEPLAKLARIAPVTFERVAGEAVFEPQGIAELVEKRVSGLCFAGARGCAPRGTRCSRLIWNQLPSL